PDHHETPSQKQPELRPSKNPKSSTAAHRAHTIFNTTIKIHFIKVDGGIIDIYNITFL
ncbi:hypothetical protein ACJX0J_042481, partial [Zea mays]